jgi:hypothetical protein
MLEQWIKNLPTERVQQIAADATVSGTTIAALARAELVRRHRGLAQAA